MARALLPAFRLREGHDAELIPLWLPPSPRSIAITRLEEKCDLIQGPQSLAGKIFETKGLQFTLSVMCRYASQYSDKEAAEGKVGDHMHMWKSEFDVKEGYTPFLIRAFAPDARLASPEPAAHSS